MGSRDGGSQSGRNVNQKTSRLKQTYSLWDKANHIFNYSGLSGSISKSGPSISITPSCGSCHDRISGSNYNSGRNSGNNHDRD